MSTLDLLENYLVYRENPHKYEDGVLYAKGQSIVG